MERLTTRDNGHPALARGYEERFTEPSLFFMLLNRLAAYEDTGLEPGDITPEPYGCVFYCNRKCNLDGDWCTEGPGCPNEICAETIKHLLELAQAKKDGRLVVLPCKVGDTVCRVITPRDTAPIITEIEIKNLWQAVDLIGRIGKKQLLVSWYLTREEAEAALKKRRAGNAKD